MFGKERKEREGKRGKGREVEDKKWEFKSEKIIIERTIFSPFLLCMGRRGRERGKKGI